MARSAKTKHVMNLVGAEPVRKPAVHPPKPAAVEKVEKAPNVPKVLESHEAVPPQAVNVRQEETVKEESQQEKPPAVEEKESVRITAIVCELVNQELGNVAERFRLKPTDSNLWELTRAALEEVRPEFSTDSSEMEKKLEKLRPQVIAAMTKAAIKVKSKEQ